MSETYKALSDQVKAARSIPSLISLEKRLERHYNNGTITARELQRLDLMVMDRLSKAVDRIAS